MTITTRCTGRGCPGNLCGVNDGIPTFRATDRSGRRSRVPAVSGWRRILVVIGATVLLASCGGISRAELDEEVRSRGGGLGSTLALESIAALEEELGDDLALRSFTMTNGQVTIDVLVPGTDDQVDTYRYGTSGLYGGGGLSEPTPVAGIGGAAALRPRLFRPERIAFEDLDQVVDDAIEAADLQDGYAQALRVDRTGERPVITVNLTSPRESVPVRYRADGRRIRDGDA